MIEKQRFVEGLAQIGASCGGGREVEGPVIASYYAILSPRLTTEEWERAVTLTLTTERFWPSPAVLLEKAGVDDATRADRAFRHMHDTLNMNGGYRFMPHEKYQEFDEPTKAGIKAVGGLMEISTCSELRWAGLVKRFCKAYIEALAPQPTLSSGATVDPAVRRLVAEVGRQMALPKGDR